MIVESHQKYRLGFAQPLPAEDREQLLKHLGQPASSSEDPLQGRAQADFISLPNWGNIVVKHYMRGGLMRHLSRRSHLRRATCRGELEFRMLESLGKSGLPVPKPLGWADRGLLFVETWLFLAEIPHSSTLAQIDQTHPDQARELIPQVSDLVDRLVELNIHHIDLHPGNVLIDAQKNAHLIDFDKAARVSCTPDELRDRHYRRWNRAIAKHQLSSELQLPSSSASNTPPTDSNPLSDVIGHSS